MSSQILADRAVRGEVSGARDVEDGHPQPLFRVATNEIDARLTLDVVTEVGAHEERIGVEQVVGERPEEALVAVGEEP